MRSLGGGSIVGRGQGGRDVAYRWRFRHKLFLAHGLVVAIVLMLLGGTLYGLISYKATTRTFDKKLVELTKAEEVRNKIRAVPDLSNPNDALALQNRIIAAPVAAE